MLCWGSYDEKFYLHWICTVALRAQSAAAWTHTNTDNAVSTDDNRSRRTLTAVNKLICAAFSVSVLGVSFPLCSMFSKCWCFYFCPVATHGVAANNSPPRAPVWKNLNNMNLLNCWQETFKYEQGQLWLFFCFELLIQGVFGLVKLSSSWEERFRNLWQHHSVKSTGWAGTCWRGQRGKCYCTPLLLGCTNPGAANMLAHSSHWTW